MFKILKVIGLILGLIVLYLGIRHMGFENVWRAILDIRYGAAFLILNSFGWIVLYTQAWRLYFTGLHLHLSFLHLLRIKISGEAVNLMTPAGFVLGDPVRMMLIKKHVSGVGHLGSVMTDRLLQSLATVMFVYCGLALFFYRPLDIPVGARIAVLSLYFFLTAGLLLLILAFLRGRALKILLPVTRLSLIRKKFPNLAGLLTEIENELKGRPAKPLLLAFLLHLGGRVLGAMEIAIIFWFLTGTFPFLLSFMMAAVTSATILIFAFIPGAIGVLEWVYATLLGLQGLDPAIGVSMQILRRLRAVFWVLMGVTLLQVQKKLARANSNQ